MSTGANFRIFYWSGTNTESELGVKPEDEAETVETDVTSAFVPEKKRNIVYGSNFSNIQASAGKLDFDGEQTFNLRDSQGDAIGDIYFNLKMSGRFSGPTGALVQGLLQEYVLARIIKRIDFYVGGSIWQTLEEADLISFNVTNLTPGSFNHFHLAARGGLAQEHAMDSLTFIYTTVYGHDNHWENDHIFNLWIPLPFFTTGDVEDTLLLAAIRDKSVTIKVKYANHAYRDDLINSGELSSLNFHSTSILVKNYMMTNFEKINMAENTIAKRVKITQHVSTGWGAERTYLRSISLDSFDLLCSHILISIEADFLYEGYWRIEYADLRIDGESFCGQIDGDFLLMYGAQSIGLMNNLYLPDKENQYDVGQQKFFYTFPIASKKYGLDGIPFDKVNNIELVIKVNELDLPLLYTVGDREPTKVCITAVGSKLSVYANGQARL